jgi:hypothetical protein|tara:strand:+ start:401 stop:589 length:189 start_codon:yes stop_codon:yes gene_type:complete
MNKDIIQLALQSLKVSLMKQRIDNRNKGYDDLTSKLLEEVIEHQKELDEIETPNVIKLYSNE